jgi:hypothetical protein
MLEREIILNTCTRFAYRELLKGWKRNSRLITQKTTFLFHLRHKNVFKKHAITKDCLICAMGLCIQNFLRPCFLYRCLRLNSHSSNTYSTNTVENLNSTVHADVL